MLSCVVSSIVSCHLIQWSLALGDFFNRTRLAKAGLGDQLSEKTDASFASLHLQV